jgi:hypothetical protein
MTVEMRTTERAGYSALQWQDGYDVNLGDVIRQHPELVLGHQVVIAWSDSDRYHLTAAQIAAGWEAVGDLVVSPVITDIAQLPTPGFDEWYVFERMPDRDRLSRFGGAVEFRPFGEGAEADEFWEQIADLRPVHGLFGGGPGLVVISRDSAVYDGVVAFYSSLDD